MLNNAQLAIARSRVPARRSAPNMLSMIPYPVNVALATRVFQIGGSIFARSTCVMIQSAWDLSRVWFQREGGFPPPGRRIRQGQLWEKTTIRSKRQDRTIDFQKHLFGGVSDEQSGKATAGHHAHDYELHTISSCKLGDRLRGPMLLD